ncbi:MAG TPA: reverse transcriptase domain-containing protein, partial [Candidatus Babeliaceae bacterium]|nr:reverse transcriptase domain-containing protein [Candidatus Babeliaceae bacterium]
ARLVGKGYNQKEGVDYFETFAPVAKLSSIRALLALATHHDLEIHQMDVKCAFLNGVLEEDIYMEQPQGFIEKGKEHLVCKLNKTLYGLKQASRQWYTKMDQTLSSLSFRRLESDNCTYVYQDKHNVVMYICLFVDDLLMFSNSLIRLNILKKKLSSLYKMKDLGEAEYILGMQIVRDRKKGILSICQSGYIRNLVQKYGLAEAKPVYTPLDSGLKLSKKDAPTTEEEKSRMAKVPYQSAIGAIMYCMLGSRPDVAYAITALSQFSSNPGWQHWNAVKRLIRYLNTTQDYKLTYRSKKGDEGPCLYGYSDADWGNNIDDRRSYTGYLFMLAGGAVSWQAKKQPTVALSSMEAEYMAATQAAKEALWWRSFLTELGMNVSNETVLLSDSKGAIDLAKNPEFHPRSKHIAIQHHFIRMQVANKSVKMEYIGTEIMAADILTKPLGRIRHHSLLKLFGIQA